MEVAAKQLNFQHTPLAFNFALTYDSCHASSYPLQLKANAPPVLEIVLFAIRSKYHGKGLGTVLTGALFEMGRRILCERVVLRAAPNAHGFWQLVGYSDFVPAEKEKEILLHNNVEFNRGCIFMERLFTSPGVGPRQRVRAALRKHQDTVSRVVDTITSVIWEPDLV